MQPTTTAKPTALAGAENLCNLWMISDAPHAAGSPASAGKLKLAPSFFASFSVFSGYLLAPENSYNYH